MSAIRIPASATTLGGGMTVRRALPTARRRLIGAWCFLDHFGPARVDRDAGLRIGPHPHIGLQTVTWLIRGELLHRDSLGSVQPIRPGELNLMTAGNGISHSEESPLPRSPELHGVQFWIALPESARHGAPAFEHHARLPRIEREGVRVTLLAGEALGAASPARVHTPLVGMDLELAPGSIARLPLRADFEHGVIVTEGEAVVDGAELSPGTLHLLDAGRGDVALATAQGARLVLVGGAPLEEPVLMWWNFVGRDKAELTAACREWNAGDARFGTVTGYDGARLEAPLPPW